MLHAYYAAVCVLMIATATFCTALIGLEIRSAVQFYGWRPSVSVRKVGGLYFWRVGKLGGSVYIAKGN